MRNNFINHSFAERFLSLSSLSEFIYWLIHSFGAALRRNLLIKIAWRISMFDQEHELLASRERRSGDEYYWRASEGYELSGTKDHEYF